MVDYRITLKNPFIRYGAPYRDPGSAIKAGHRLGEPFYVFEHDNEGPVQKVYEWDG